MRFEAGAVLPYLFCVMLAVAPWSARADPIMRSAAPRLVPAHPCSSFAGGFSHASSAFKR